MQAVSSLGTQIFSFVLLHSFTDQLLGVWHYSRAGSNKDRPSWSLHSEEGEDRISSQQAHNKVSDGGLCYGGKRQSKERTMDCEGRRR